jgi:hypothetical protein
MQVRVLLEGGEGIFAQRGLFTGTASAISSRDERKLREDAAAAAAQAAASSSTAEVPPTSTVAGGAKWGQD